MKLKTKKILIFITNIILTIYSFIMAYLYLNNILEVPTSVETENSMNNVLLSQNMQIILLLFIGILSIITILLSKNLVKNKKKLIFLEILQLFFGSIYHIVSSIILIIILCIKTKDIVEEKPQKIVLPQIDFIKFSIKEKIIYSFIWIFIFITLFTTWFEKLLGIDLELSNFQSFMLQIGFYVLTFLLFFKPIYKDLKEGFNKLFKNFKNYFSYLGPRILIWLLFYLTTSLIILLIVGQQATNQAELNNLPLWMTSTLAILFAPLIEEIIFRGILKKIIGNNNMFIILSTFLFGLVHVLFLETNLLLYLWIIPYALIGFFLAKTYTRTNNLGLSIFLHSAWNTIICTFTIIITLLSNILA